MGATYYVALTRRPPYEGRNTEEIMNCHRAAPPPDPRGVLPHLPAAVYRVIEKAMAKEPAERYQTAGELLTALEALDFAALDPRAGLNLQTVSAQISAVTPEVGEHVGAVIKEAARHADTSQSGSRLLDTIEGSSAGRWWLLAGGVAAAVCLAAVIVAVVFALRPRSEPPPALPHETSQSVGTAPSAKPPAEVRPAVVAKPPAAQTTRTPVTSEVPPGPAAEVQPADQPADTAAQPEETQTKTEVPLEAAKATYEEAQAWEKQAWSTDPASVYEKYENVAKYYPNTPYAEKAKADIERLQKGTEQPSAPGPGDKPEETKPPAGEPQKPAPPPKDQKTPAKDSKTPAKK
jgi:serine/threonine-protein kinase